MSPYPAPKLFHNLFIFSCITYLSAAVVCGHFFKLHIPRGNLSYFCQQACGNAGSLNLTSPSLPPYSQASTNAEVNFQMSCLRQYA